ncbi:hypothetical protein B296_00023050 [Ensete ventricosum]|uniref:Fructose-bisphosphatase n=1 Tax=Ensete ventricosum TaxID=4639 RepID=A0A427AI95_ENSVE|nr:hypothetical protein B296_00023050 [Ensete ventricosum]
MPRRRQHPTIKTSRQTRSDVAADFDTTDISNLKAAVEGTPPPPHATTNDQHLRHHRLLISSPPLPLLFNHPTPGLAQSTLRRKEVDDMETGAATCARGVIAHSVLYQSRLAVPSSAPSLPRSHRHSYFTSASVFFSQGLKSSSILGDFLRLTPPKSARACRAVGSSSSLAIKCEIGDSLVRTASCGGTACVNSFGDEQLAVDLLANKLLFEVKLCNTRMFASTRAPKRSPSCKTWEDQWKMVMSCVAILVVVNENDMMVDLIDADLNINDAYASCVAKRRQSDVASTQMPHLRPLPPPIVAFDPLDGSSIVDTNFTVGTIFGVWPGDKLTGVTGRDQVAAAMGIYGPRTTYVIALKDCPGTHEFLLLDEGWFSFASISLILMPERLHLTLPCGFRELINYYVREKYTLRYTGGMVPDVNQIIVKEKGIFTNVTSPSSKAKLRLLFEVAPLGFLVEKAGGYSSDGTRSVLDKVIENLDDRTQVAYGSKNEIIRFEETLYGSSRLTKAAGCKEKSSTPASNLNH